MFLCDYKVNILFKTIKYNFKNLPLKLRFKSFLFIFVCLQQKNYLNFKRKFEINKKWLKTKNIK